MKLNAKQLRVTPPGEGDLEQINRNPIYIVLDNVLDTYNIGAIFRLADAVAAKEVILCGGTEKPPCSRIHKAAVGTETWVPWRYFASTKEAIAQLRKEIPGIQVIAVEQDERSIPLSELSGYLNTPHQLSPNLGEREGGEGLPVAVVVGHETEGVSREVLDMADMIVELPMYGVNKSLNVMVSTGIVLYKVLGG
jgi:23S rRNA (guanosine2251-2'-O)-methyltransferase